jgi:hypothetical protein
VWDAHNFELGREEGMGERAGSRNMKEGLTNTCRSADMPRIKAHARSISAPFIKRGRSAMDTTTLILVESMT